MSFLYECLYDHVGSTCHSPWLSYIQSQGLIILGYNKYWQSLPSPVLLQQINRRRVYGPPESRFPVWSSCGTQPVRWHTQQLALKQLSMLTEVSQSIRKQFCISSLARSPKTTADFRIGSSSFSSPQALYCNTQLEYVPSQELTVNCSLFLVSQYKFSVRYLIDNSLTQMKNKSPHWMLCELIALHSYSGNLFLL